MGVGPRNSLIVLLLPSVFDDTVGVSSGIASAPILREESLLASVVSIDPFGVLCLGLDPAGVLAVRQFQAQVRRHANDAPDDVVRDKFQSLQRSQQARYEAQRGSLRASKITGVSESVGGDCGSAQSDGLCRIISMSNYHSPGEGAGTLGTNGVVRCLNQLRRNLAKLSPFGESNVPLIDAFSISINPRGQNVSPGAMAKKKGARDIDKLLGTFGGEAWRTAADLCADGRLDAVMAHGGEQASLASSTLTSSGCIDISVGWLELTKQGAQRLGLEGYDPDFGLADAKCMLFRAGDQWLLVVPGEHGSAHLFHRLPAVTLMRYTDRTAAVSLSIHWLQSSVCSTPTPSCCAAILGGVRNTAAYSAAELGRGGMHVAWLLRRAAADASLANAARVEGNLWDASVHDIVAQYYREEGESALKKHRTLSKSLV